MRRDFSRKLSIMMLARERKEENLTAMASKLDDKHFDVYRPFFSAPGALDQESLKKHSFTSLFFIPKMLLRRVIFLYIAMFLSSYAWIQMIIFVLMALLNIFYMGFVKPHEDPTMNVIDIVNEIFTLICAYLCMSLVGLSQNPEMSDNTGWCLSWSLRWMLLINLLVIANGLVKQIYLRVKRFRNQLKGKVR